MRGAFEGTFALIVSKNECPFGETDFPIDFTRPPAVGESFLFRSRLFGDCNTSEVLAIRQVEDMTFLLTRNSAYVLAVN